MQDINPNNLNKEFDNIRDYMFLIQEIISKKVLRYDADFDLTMLPKLKNGEFWLKTSTGFRASDFKALEELIKDAFKNFFGIIGGENPDYTFTGVTGFNGDWVKTNLLGQVVDGIAVQSDDSLGTYYVLTSGFVEIPKEETDDLGNPFIVNGYYYQSLTVDGKFSTVCPVSGICKKVFKVIEANLNEETVKYALILNYPHTIGNGTEVSEFIKYNNTILEMQEDLTLGINQRVDVLAERYKIVADVQPIALNNGLYAELLKSEQVETNETNISENTVKIETNETNIETNTNNITTNETNIELNADAIDNNTDAINEIVELPNGIEVLYDGSGVSSITLPSGHPKVGHNYYCVSSNGRCASLIWTGKLSDQIVYEGYNGGDAFKLENNGVFSHINGTNFIYLISYSVITKQ